MFIVGFWSEFNVKWVKNNFLEENCFLKEFYEVFGSYFGWRMGDFGWIDCFWWNILLKWAICGKNCDFKLKVLKCFVFSFQNLDFKTISFNFLIDFFKFELIFFDFLRTKRLSSNSMKSGDFLTVFQSQKCFFWSIFELVFPLKMISHVIIQVKTIFSPIFDKILSN